MSRGMFRGGCGLWKSLGSLCWWVGLCSCPVGCSAWALPGSYRLLGGARSWCQMVASRRVHADEYSPVLPPPMSLSPQWAPAVPTSPGDLARPAGRSGPASYEVTVFALDPSEHKTLCVPSKCGVSFFPIPVEFLHLNPGDLQSQMLWRLLPISDPHMGEPDVRLRTLLLENFCDVIFLQFVGHLSQGYGIWLYCRCAPFTVSLSFFFMSLDIEYLFC